MKSTTLEMYGIESGILHEMLSAYMDCALWSSTNEDGEPLDDNDYSDSDIAPETVSEMIGDCVAFVSGLDPADLAEYLERSTYSQMGHDFWLTRNRHGAGFWDRGLGELGERLTDAAKAYGSVYLYIGDDGQVYSG